MLHVSVSRSLRLGFALIASLMTGGALPGQAQVDVPSDGIDGDLIITGAMTIDLTQAITGDWDTPAVLPGKGVYDPEKWAVVFRYRSVSLNPGATLTFKNHPSRAPVVWLVQGNVTIRNTITISGTPARLHQQPPEAPPGGFRGGFGHSVGVDLRSGGFGPGGGTRGLPSGAGGPASHATLSSGSSAGATYGDPSVLQLIGGSGSGGGNGFNFAGEGAYTGATGGGAMLIAARGTILLEGNIDADGASGLSRNGGSSGGAVRLIAARVEGNGQALARAGFGSTGHGYVRVEAFEATLRQSNPPYSLRLLTGSAVDIWPPDTAPSVRISRVFSAEVGDLSVPLDPRARFDGAPNADVALSSEAPVRVEVAATNVPLDWSVSLRVVPRNHDDFTVELARVSGDASSSLWQAEITFPSGIAALQARADAP